MIAGAQSDHDRWIARTLKVGTWLSACLLFAGLILAAVNPAASPPGSLLNMSEFVAATLHGQLSLHEALLYAGILTMIFTPVLRVGAAIVTFITEHDLKFIVVSMMVFAVLILEVILSLS